MTFLCDDRFFVFQAIVSEADEVMTHVQTNLSDQNQLLFPIVLILVQAILTFSFCIMHGKDEQNDDDDDDDDYEHDHGDYNDNDA
jgi:hypothetical protein